MKMRCARDALCDSVILVEAEWRPVKVRDLVHALQATHAAVCEGETFRAILPLREVATSHPERIFGDLIDRSKRLTSVKAETPLQDVSRVMEVEKCDALAVLDADESIVGFVTQESLSESLFEWTQSLYSERTSIAEERFRGLMECAPDAVLVVAEDGRITKANRRAEEMFSYKKGELIRLSIEQLVPERLRNRNCELLTRFREDSPPGKQPKVLEMIGVRKDSSEFPAEISIRHSQSVSPAFVTAAIRDISIRKQTEYALQESEAKFRALAENSPAMIAIYRGRRRLYVNPAASAITGYSREELLHSDLLEVVHPDYREVVCERNFKRQRGEPASDRYEVKLLTKERSVRWIDLSVTPMEYGGEPAFLANAIDITERKQSVADLQLEHQQLERALAQLKQTQQQVVQQERLRALGQMASGIAHDLNNTLSPVLGYAELAASSADLPADVRKWLEYILTAARDAAVMVERLGEFYRPEVAGGLDEPVRLDELLRQIPDLTRPKWIDEAQRSGRSIQFEVDVEDGVTVLGRHSELRELFTNLVFNSVDAMELGGTITIRLYSTPEGALVELTDTGIGMTKDVAGRCFEPFFTSKPSEGSGLGLSVCHGIVQRHGGRFEIDTQPGHGTTMRVVFPLSEEQTIVDQEDHTAVDVLPRRRVLYIDDDPRLRQLATTLFDQLGQDVDCAHGGIDGLKRFRESQHDVLVTDLGMPDIDGRELTRIVKTTAPHVPVILVTGWAARYIPEEGEREVSPDLVVTKPLTHTKIRDALAKVFYPETMPASDSR